MNLLKTKYLKALLYIVPLMIGSYFLFSGGLSLEASRSSKALWNLGHVVYFALLTFIALKQPFFMNMAIFKRSLVLIIASIIIGTLIEIAQYGTARNTDILDVAHDVLGSLLILAFYKGNLLKAPYKYVFFFKTLTVLLLTISLWPLSIALWDEQHARSQFPILADFSSQLEIKRWTGNASYKYVNAIDDVSDAMQINFATQHFSTLYFKYYEYDWRGFKTLTITLFNPIKETVGITLRIHDLMHKPRYLTNDRFIQRLQVKHGWNTFELAINDIKNAPKSREMDLKNIIGFALYTVRLRQSRTLYLKSIVLSP